MKPTVQFSWPGKPLLRLASRFATKVEVEADIFRFESDMPDSLSVRIVPNLLEELLDEGKLYAIESATKPLFGGRFRHQGRWYLVCKKADWEQLCKDGLARASATNPDQRVRIAGEQVDRQLRDLMK